MSLRSPPGTGRQWPQLLAFIIDDDDRTRRAGLLLRHLTSVLLAIGTMAFAVLLLARHSGWYAGAGTSGALAFLLRRRRTRA
jgi:hypothetical protein